MIQEKWVIQVSYKEKVVYIVQRDPRKNNFVTSKNVYAATKFNNMSSAKLIRDVVLDPHYRFSNVALILLK